MKFQALLVLNDNGAAEVLSHVLADYQVDSERCAQAQTAAQKLDQKRFEAVFVDLDDSPSAAQVLQSVRQGTSKKAVTVALLSDRTNVRRAFGIGANFVLYKPISGEQAHASLRAAIALLKRERRRAFRVPVQLPVTLSWPDAPEVEGIMLDLSEDGMDVLSAQPLQESQTIEFHFRLSDTLEIKASGRVAWANSNGQSGVQFTDCHEPQRDQLRSWVGANAPEAPPDDPEPLSQCKLSDLSLGGCYVETESPFPRQTRIDLCFRAAHLEFHLDGIVRVMHPGQGMGVEFASLTPQAVKQVEKFIDFLCNQSEVMPQLSVAPKSIDFVVQSAPVTQEDDSEDPLLRLLHSEQTMGQDEFLTALRSQRQSQAQSTTA